MQLGFDIPTARRHFNSPVLQLAIASGVNPLEALEELAADHLFKGRVIAGVDPGSFEFPALLHQQYLAYHQGNRAVFDGFEAWGRAEIESRLVIKRSSCNLRTTIGSLLRRQFPDPVARTMDVDRQIHSDFSQIDIPKLRRELLNHIDEKRAGRLLGRPSPTWAAVVNRYREAAEQIQQRGGKVTFVWMPISGPRATLDEAAYPRAQFWDVFAKTVTPVAQTIHFADYEDLRSFECPDMIHLDTADASRFTQSLLNHIQ